MLFNLNQGYQGNKARNWLSQYVHVERSLNLWESIFSKLSTATEGTELHLLDIAIFQLMFS